MLSFLGIGCGSVVESSRMILVKVRGFAMDLFVGFCGLGKVAGFFTNLTWFLPGFSPSKNGHLQSVTSWLFPVIHKTYNINNNLIYYFYNYGWLKRSSL